MTPEEKQLLLKDLCERLPYGVKVDVNFYDATKELSCDLIRDLFLGEKCLRPYLRSMSSMTEEELKEFRACSCVYDLHPNFHPMMCNIANELNMFDWLNAHHFDYRGLIPMGLALEAKEGMYKIK